MRVIEGIRDLGLDAKAPAVTIGNFDGVHLGHQKVILSARDDAHRRGAPSVVCTFRPHTMQVLSPVRAPQLLQTPEQKLAAIAELGIDVTVVIPFDRKVAATGRRRFVDEFLIGELHVGTLHVSKGFSFGRDSAGSTAFLERRAPGGDFEVLRIPPIIVRGEPVSSTRVRALLAAGDLARANELLTRPYALSGKVVRGAGRGHGLDAPTANLALDNGCVPANGVYAAIARHDGSEHVAVANIGTRPTFEGPAKIVVEAHLLDVRSDLYDATLELALLERLRAEERFASPAALARQIQSDIAHARDVHSRRASRGAG